MNKGIHWLDRIRRIDVRWWLVIGFVLMCCAYEYGRVFGSRPFPHHVSRQTACLSMTWQIYVGGGGPFEPCLHNLFADGRTTGRSSAEFPGFYWLIAQVWKVTGPREDVYRLVMLLLHFTATWCLFLGFRKLLRHAGWAVLVALFFFATPVLAYFGVAFMTDVPAFDLALIGCWVLFRRHPSQRVADVVIAATLFTLAGLLKITALMAPLALFIWSLLEWLPWMRPGRSGRVLPHKWATTIAFGAAFGVVWAWYTYSQAYNDLHGVSFSNSDIWPLWELPPDRARYCWEFGRDILVYQLFDTPAWCALWGMAAYVLVMHRHVSRSLAAITILLAAGTVLYILLWWVTLDAHEYYYINPLVTIVALIALFLDTLRRRHPAALRSPIALGAFALLVSYDTVYTANNHEMRTRGDEPLSQVDLLPLYHDREYAFWDQFQNWSYREMLDLEPYNRSIGIAPDDPVLVPEDESVCAALYLMGQRGWAQFAQRFDDEASVQERIDLGAAYLIVRDQNWLNKPHMQRFYAHPIGQHRSVRVFDLRPYRGPAWRAPRPWAEWRQGL